MTTKETIERNIGLTFDFLKQAVRSPGVVDALKDGAVIDFVEKDFVKVEKADAVKPDVYFRVKTQFEAV
jgi:hypothetical protein